MKSWMSTPEEIYFLKSPNKSAVDLVLPSLLFRRLLPHLTRPFVPSYLWEAKP